MAGGSVVGLDIGSSTMKVTEMRRSGRGIEVTAVGIAPTPQDAFENSIIVDPQALGLAVKVMMREAGVTARTSVSSVSGQSAVVVRVIDVPQMNPGELDEAIKFEAERHVPFAISDTILDYAPIERPEGYAEGQNMDVLLAVAQSDMIDRHVEMLTAAGLKAEAIDVEPLALGRTFLESGGEAANPAGYTVVLVNLGAAVTDIAIFRDQLPTLLRSLPLGGNSLTTAIADSMGLDLDTAEQYKRTHGEVLLDQIAQPTTEFGGSGAFGGGFVDFSPPPTDAASAPASDVAPLSDSGRMPFDFSMPGDAPSGGFDSPPPGSLSGSLDPGTVSGLAPGYGSQSGNLEPSPSGSLDPTVAGFQSPPGSVSGSLESEPGFFQPDFAAHTHTGDLTQLNAPGAAAQQVFMAIAPVLQELVQELRRSLDFHRAKVMDTQVNEVILTGGSALLKNLAPYIESELGITTRVGNPLANFTVAAKNLSAERLTELATVLPVSIGLGTYSLMGTPSRKARRKK